MHCIGRYLTVCVGAINQQLLQFFDDHWEVVQQAYPELEVEYQVTVRARVLPSCVCDNGSHATDGFTRGVRMWIRRSTC